MKSTSDGAQAANEYFLTTSEYHEWTTTQIMY